MREALRNKLWHCFRPMIDMDLVIEPKSVVDPSTDMGFTYIKEENMEGVKVAEYGCSLDSEKSSTIVPQPTKKTFSKAIKAVFLDTALAKRVRDKKRFKQGSSNSKLSFLKSKKKSLDFGSVKQTNHTILSSSSSSATSLSSSSSSSSTSESEVSPKRKNNVPVWVNQSSHTDEKYSKESEMGKPGFNSGLYMLLLSLTITIMWGRYWAVIFTTISWLFLLIPAWYAGKCKPENEKKLPENESEDYKKKVIMEGLLERNHIRRWH